MIIAQLTDSHILDLVSDDSDRALQRYNDLKACIDDINREKPQPDIVVHTGDISQSGKRSEYELVQDLTQKLYWEVSIRQYLQRSQKEMRMWTL